MSSHNFYSHSCLFEQLPTFPWVHALLLTIFYDLSCCLSRKINFSLCFCQILKIVWSWRLSILSFFLREGGGWGLSVMTFIFVSLTSVSRKLAFSLTVLQPQGIILQLLIPLEFPSELKKRKSPQRFHEHVPSRLWITLAASVVSDGVKMATQFCLLQPRI